MYELSIPAFEIYHQYLYLVAVLENMRKKVIWR